MAFFQKKALRISLREGDPKTLVVSGRLTGRNVEILKRHCPEDGPLRIDLAGVQSIDGRGLAGLVALGTRPRIKLCAIPRCIRIPLEVTRVFQVLDIED